uniref:Uncharacterized protein n=1 Tax=Candidatus Kentrum sp. TUN TaxID=2126343 RepID=A0A451AA41_9GAMM|nr:MAG: hypothetical protein BECKTUN1418F_GA0071002_109015 [Candidatus Kentron sp. TUN]VFK56973.1 MAG: hypothetical protein BECKTUN1418D_GA0071000_105617 [Candidatus Kentron sp. TUN]VFK62900.1 MAG: hypothetical protein BECKTUN1418E_GA0071001_108817 [Candidatus Kentron sp. TUN]
MVNHIYTWLAALLGDDLERFRAYVEMVHILSTNRDLTKQMEEADKMLTQIDVERLPVTRCWRHSNDVLVFGACKYQRVCRG